MAVHVDEKVGVKTYDSEDDGEAPSMTEGVPEDGIAGAEPTPVSADWLVCVQEKSSEAYHSVRKGLQDGLNHLKAFCEAFKAKTYPL